MGITIGHSQEGEDRDVQPTASGICSVLRYSDLSGPNFTSCFLTISHRGQKYQSKSEKQLQGCDRLEDLPSQPAHYNLTVLPTPSPPFLNLQAV